MSSDNKTASIAEWDDDALARMLAELRAKEVGTPSSPRGHTSGRARAPSRSRHLVTRAHTRFPTTKVCPRWGCDPAGHVVANP
jgi:hypothetical protein